MVRRPDPRESPPDAPSPGGGPAGRGRAPPPGAPPDVEPHLRGHLLIAMPGMRDPRFGRAVVFLCEHSERGSMGLVVNRASPEVAFPDLARHLGIDVPEGAARLPVHIGGPVEPGRGFVLHSADYAREGATLRVSPRFGLTATLDVLREIAQGAGPHRALLALGYAGWAPGQLEAEITANGWLTTTASAEGVFDLPDGAKWGAALASLGVDPVTLSSVGGRA